MLLFQLPGDYDSPRPFTDWNTLWCGPDVCVKPSLEVYPADPCFDNNNFSRKTELQDWLIDVKDRIRLHFRGQNISISDQLRLTNQYQNIADRMVTASIENWIYCSALPVPDEDNNGPRKMDDNVSWDWMFDPAFDPRSLLDASSDIRGKSDDLRHCAWLKFERWPVDPLHCTPDERCDPLYRCCTIVASTCLDGLSFSELSRMINAWADDAAIAINNWREDWSHCLNIEPAAQNAFIALGQARDDTMRLYAKCNEPVGDPGSGQDEGNP